MRPAKTLTPLKTSLPLPGRYGYATTTANSQSNAMTMRRVALAVSGCTHGASTASKKPRTRCASHRVAHMMSTTVNSPGIAVTTPSASVRMVSRR